MASIVTTQIGCPNPLLSPQDEQYWSSALLRARGGRPGEPVASMDAREFSTISRLTATMHTQLEGNPWLRAAMLQLVPRPLDAPTKVEGPKGVLLLGGSGTRLAPLTDGVNKHLLPIGQQPMAFYSLTNLIRAGARDIVIVTSPLDLPRFQELFGYGQEFGVSISYRVQEHPNGTLQAIKLAQDHVGSRGGFVAFGDMFLDKVDLENWGRGALTAPNNAHYIAAKSVGLSDLECFQFGSDGSVTDLVEKPDRPPSKYALVGLFYFPERFLDTAHEISQGMVQTSSELNARLLWLHYLEKGLADTHIADGATFLDLGTPDRIERANALMGNERFGVNARLAPPSLSPHIVAGQLGLIDLTQMRTGKYLGSTYGEDLKAAQYCANPIPNDEPRVDLRAVSFSRAAITPYHDIVRPLTDASHVAELHKALLGARGIWSQGKILPQEPERVVDMLLDSGILEVALSHTLSGFDELVNFGTQIVSQGIDYRDARLKMGRLECPGVGVPLGNGRKIFIDPGLHEYGAQGIFANRLTSLGRESMIVSSVGLPSAQPEGQAPSLRFFDNFDAQRADTAREKFRQQYLELAIALALLKRDSEIGFELIRATIQSLSSSSNFVLAPFGMRFTPEFQKQYAQDQYLAWEWRSKIENRSSEQRKPITDLYKKLMVQLMSIGQLEYLPRFGKEVLNMRRQYGQSILRELAKDKISRGEIQGSIWESRELYGAPLLNNTCLPYPCPDVLLAGAEAHHGAWRKERSTSRLIAKITGIGSLIPPERREDAPFNKLTVAMHNGDKLNHIALDILMAQQSPRDFQTFLDAAPPGDPYGLLTQRIEIM